MNLFTIHFNKEDYLYEQLYEYIVERIHDKSLKPGDKLPSKKKLAKYLHISENTVDKAYSQLLVEGYIYSLERSGHYVEKLQLPIRSTPLRKNREDTEEKIEYEYDFSYAGIDPDIFDATSYKQAFKEVSKDPTLFSSRGPSQGSINLRESIKDYLFSSRGFSYSIEQMIISSGTEALYQILLQLMEEDRVFGLENPGYQRIERYLNRTKFEYHPIELDDDGIKIEELIEKEIDLVTITPSHQFPSGIIYPMKKRLDLLSWAYDYNSYIIEDDYDSEFRYSGKPIPALKSLDNRDKVIYMGSFSKSFSPALRISYMILPYRLMDKYNKIKDIYPCPVSYFTQETFGEWMERGFFYKHLNKTRTYYRQKHKKIVSCIEKSNLNLQLHGTDCGLHMVLEINENISRDRLKENLKKDRIKIDMLRDYYYGVKEFFPRLLLGFSTLPMDEIEEAIKVLLNCIKKSLE
ncbi:PLP-dependent aminotransferase family protein [Lagierella sp.]|uniref:MocR-like pyridoxine biosynthesis transcription factor PdxR n=1 Tax=Lagierella sp. TaxID=2849657 RepID=UPI002625371C|nr:PLP-dependent aminotransferase family protein [Lagierella sp.]